MIRSQLDSLRELEKVVFTPAASTELLYEGAPPYSPEDNHKSL